MITKEKTANKKRLFKRIIILILIICIIILTKFILARYMTTLNGNSKADIAKWTLKVTDGINESLAINLAETRDEVQEAEVNSNYIGPGTSGKFIIEVDATNTEVSLAYNINMEMNYNDNNEFPKNLIFYSDDKMTNAIYHTDNAIELNGFIAENEENKKIQHKIYWKWDFETGQTENDKNKNDIADSLWIGKHILIPITVVGTQVNQNPYSNQCNVTFDANGGVIKGYGNSEKMTKNVNIDNPLETLPVTTKANNQFDGWVGKNLLNYNNILVKAAMRGIVVDEDGYVSDITPEEDGRPWVYDNCNWKIRLEPGIYTLSLHFFNTETNSIKGNIRVILPNEKLLLNDINDNKSFTLNIKETSNIGILVKSWDGIYKIQLEKGDVSTNWEPYKIINSEVEFINENIDTLTAQWTKLTSDFDGANILNYNNLSSAASRCGIVVDDEGYISDITPEDDNRAWNYNESNWNMSIEPGTYTLTLDFKQQCTNTVYSRIDILSSEGRKIIN